MERISELRRYLVSLNTRHLPHIDTDVLVIGSGVAGLLSAVEAARGGRVLIVSKDKLGESNTMHAQGGIAAVFDTSDSFEEHIKDTLEAGQGLCNPKVVEEVIREGPRRIRWLMELGTSFDHEDGHLALTREGGHSHARVIHGKGDSTGMVVEEALLEIVKRNSRISTLDHSFAIDLLAVEGACRGALLWHRHKGKVVVWAKETILATGGCGQLYRETTNSPVATGDGIAMAYRVGAVLEDLEFVQFHPTTLYIAGAARALISEAVRGEGGILRNKKGERFMQRYHPMAELAPRDIVSRSVLHEMRSTDYTHVYLDVRHIPRERLIVRFPKIWSICASFHIDISREMIPVRPSAHYMIGGIKVGGRAHTNIRHLYACGEAASTGLHGANRLGSNSLLECLVYGHRAGREAAAGLKKTKSRAHAYPMEIELEVEKLKGLDLEDIRESLKSLMWRDVGVERDREHLKDAGEKLAQWSEYVLSKEFHSPQGWELQNMLTLAKLITLSALEREETRGVHYRSDFTSRDDTHWKRHITLQNARP
ncbi:MAG TPA: L-aspartate oxidase [Candidatus Hypogeohydataceae bacterium YC38]